MATIEKIKIHHLIRWEYEAYKSTWVGFEILQSYAYYTGFVLIFTVFALKNKSTEKANQKECTF